jgi:hypothetical protein
MQKTNTKSERSRVAVKQAGKALDKGLSEVKTPSQAADVLDRIENAAGDMEEQDLAPVGTLLIQSNKPRPSTTQPPLRLQKSAPPWC